MTGCSQIFPGWGSAWLAIQTIQGPSPPLMHGHRYAAQQRTPSHHIDDTHWLCTCAPAIRDEFRTPAGWSRAHGGGDRASDGAEAGRGALMHGKGSEPRVSAASTTTARAYGVQLAVPAPARISMGGGGGDGLPPMVDGNRGQPSPVSVWQSRSNSTPPPSCAGWATRTACRAQGRQWWCQWQRQLPAQQHRRRQIAAEDADGPAHHHAGLARRRTARRVPRGRRQQHQRARRRRPRRQRQPVGGWAQVDRWSLRWWGWPRLDWLDTSVFG